MPTIKCIEFCWQQNALRMFWQNASKDHVDSKLAPRMQMYWPLGHRGCWSAWQSLRACHQSQLRRLRLSPATPIRHTHTPRPPATPSWSSRMHTKQWSTGWLPTSHARWNQQTIVHHQIRMQTVFGYRLCMYANDWLPYTYTRGGWRPSMHSYQLQGTPSV